MAKFSLGQSITRVEDLTLIRGAGRYADDVRLANEAHAFVVRSPHAHAAIKPIDATAARKAPGVLAVLTGADVKADGLGEIPCMIPVTNADGSQRGETPRPLLAIDRVRHVGDPVALVVAESLGRAKDAAELIEIDYDPLPAVADTYAATKPGAPSVWPDIKSNICFDIVNGDAKAVDAAFARAKHVVKLELVNNRLVANPIEPRAALADYDAATDRSTLYTPTQGPHVIHGQIADPILKLGAAKLRVVSGNVGGGVRDEDLPAPGAAARRLGVAEAEAAGALDRRAERDLRLRRAGPRQLHDRRARARRGREVPRAARDQLRQHGRVSLQLRAVHPAAPAARAVERRTGSRRLS